jgi:hypothetical protein
MKELISEIIFYEDKEADHFLSISESEKPGDIVITLNMGNEFAIPAEGFDKFLAALSTVQKNSAEKGLE